MDSRLEDRCVNISLFRSGDVEWSIFIEELGQQVITRGVLSEDAHGAKLAFAREGGGVVFRGMVLSVEALGMDYT